ncbi:glycosyltransferase family 1 protein [Microbacterium sp. NPDC057650]|uniref:glycosyltransferase family 1 protein n=1 Tax=unclassified Microbacterium TaxID=2609290 RepID=UPI00366DB4E9
MTSSSRRRVLVFTFTPIDREPRALKQIAVLKDDYDVTTAGFGPAPVPGVPHIELEALPTSRGVLSIRGVYSLLILLRQYRLLSRLLPRNASAYERLSPHEWDLIIAHDVSTVPVARRLRSTHGILVDLHEYATRQGENSLRWRLVEGGYFRWILKKHVSKAAAISTVGQGIVDEYRREFGLDSDLVVNATPFRDIEPTPTPSPIRLVHSGAVAATRKLEIMIEAVKLTRVPVTLDLYLVGSEDAYFQSLRDRAAGDDRIVFRDPVPYAELVTRLSQYDIGLAMIAPSTFNLLWCLPNKFFDYIQARLAIITGPSPEMARLTNEYGLGAVTGDFTGPSLAAVLDSLDPSRVDEWKAAADRHARELSSETQVLVWKRMVDDLFAGRRA